VTDDDARAFVRASKRKPGCRAGRVAPPIRNRGGRHERIQQDRPDEADEQTPKPGEPDTETEGGFPKEAPESKDDKQQSKQDQ
jgi:hypothetical protein